jgi:phytoene synthase
MPILKPGPDSALHMAKADVLACRGLLRTGSRSFHAASLLLPQPFRDAAVSLYAFCRQADDGIDDSPHPERALAEFTARLDAIYQNIPGDDPADRNLAVVVRRHGLPRALLDALLEGFAWDCRGRTYADLPALMDYAARVAGSVGVMMAVLMGEREPSVLARAADLGVAMQLTNIARDVGEDARAGRLYLPLQWLDDLQIDAEEIRRRPAHSKAMASVIQRLLVVADGLYRRAEAGINRLPGNCRPCIFTARLLYAEIGHELRRRQCDPFSQRAVVSPARKCRVLAGLCRVPRLDDTGLNAPPLPQVEFLIEAVRSSPAPREQTGRQSAPRRGLVRVLDLFEELERRERFQAGKSGLRPRREVAVRTGRDFHRRVIHAGARGAAS